MIIENITCPLCGGPMVSRINKAKQQRFWGCKSYPECKGTRNTDGESAQDREDNREDEDRWKRRYD